ncbi:hypothetical protein [Actinoplanes sp. RD1]|uniref:hypothetical protein n=1 Tax=Actinoplanes sp. RD1 TaxID=3064538 RepID=UPI002740EA6B|nr:hypothetical protein [Actinoplanes sp. RD1]
MAERSLYRGHRTYRGVHGDPPAEGVRAAQTCAPGAPCLSTRTGEFCACPPGQTCRNQCSTVRTCEINWLLCLTLPFGIGCIPQCRDETLCATESFCQPA